MNPFFLHACRAIGGFREGTYRFLMSRLGFFVVAYYLLRNCPSFTFPLITCACSGIYNCSGILRVWVIIPGHLLPQFFVMLICRPKSLPALFLHSSRFVLRCKHSISVSGTGCCAECESWIRGWFGLHMFSDPIVSSESANSEFIAGWVVL